MSNGDAAGYQFISIPMLCLPEVPLKSCGGGQARNHEMGVEPVWRLNGLEHGDLEADIATIKFRVIPFFVSRQQEDPSPAKPTKLEGGHTTKNGWRQHQESLHWIFHTFESNKRFQLHLFCSFWFLSKQFYEYLRTEHDRILYSNEFCQELLHRVSAKNILDCHAG